MNNVLSFLSLLTHGHSYIHNSSLPRLVMSMQKPIVKQQQPFRPSEEILLSILYFKKKVDNEKSMVREQVIKESLGSLSLVIALQALSLYANEKLISFIYLALFIVKRMIIYISHNQFYVPSPPQNIFKLPPFIFNQACL